MNLKCGIYKITNVVTGDFYVGQSINLNFRKANHFSKLLKGTHTNIHLQRAYNKYGKENFKFEIVLYCEPFELTRYEQALIDKEKPTYNICKECVDSRKGIPASEEARLKMSISRKGMRNNRHWVPSEEFRKNMSEIMKRRPPRHGWVPTQENRENMSKAHLGKHLSEEAKKKVSEFQKGNTYNLGRVLTDEHKEKIRLATLGRRHSDETKLKMKESANNRKTKYKGIFYSFVSPEGTTYKTNNIELFCREHGGLSPTDIRRLKNKEKMKYKGWTLTQENE